MVSLAYDDIYESLKGGDPALLAQYRDAKLFAKIAMFREDLAYLGFDLALSSHDDESPPRMQLDITAR